MPCLSSSIESDIRHGIKTGIYDKLKSVQVWQKDGSSKESINHVGTPEDIVNHPGIESIVRSILDKIDTECTDNDRICQCRTKELYNISIGALKTRIPDTFGISAVVHLKRRHRSLYNCTDEDWRESYHSDPHQFVEAYENDSKTNFKLTQDGWKAF